MLANNFIKSKNEINKNRKASISACCDGEKV